jgi:glycosyltransferase involved in cell wall biosynthesis
MERIVREHDLGAVAESAEPAPLAEALAAVLERLDREGQSWRERIARTSRERFGWPAAATAYRSLVRSLVPGTGPAGEGGDTGAR